MKEDKMYLIIVYLDYKMFDYFAKNIRLANQLLENYVGLNNLDFKNKKM